MSKARTDLTVEYQELSRLFAECLELGVVQADDDFFELGGSSQSAVRLAAEIRRVFGLEVTIADVFRHPSIRKLSAMLETIEPTAQPITRADRHGNLPVSFAQERLWITDAFSGPNILYNVPLLIDLHGDLDVDALSAAVGDVVGRHEALRTCIVMNDLDLHQVVLPPVAIGMRIVSSTTDTVRRDVLATASRPFDLSTGIPLRAELFKCGPDRHVLLLLIHHIAVDGWSLKAMVNDLGFAYTMRLAGAEPAWPPLPVQYADFTVWQRRMFDLDNPSENCLRHTAFWRATLDGMPEVTTMDTDRPRPAVRSHRGRQVEIVIDRARHQALADFARGKGLTVFVLVHAAIVVLLRLRNSGDDIAVGATVAGRPDTALENLIGFFVNTVILRVNLSGNPKISEVLQRVYQTDLTAMDHQEYPFNHAIALLNPTRSMAYHPGIQILLAFQVGQLLPPRMPGLRAEVEQFDLGIAKFDLTFDLTEYFEESSLPDGIRGHLEFSTDLFDLSTAESIVHDLDRLLGVIVHEPELCLDEVFAEGY
ncbi:condensation domain-containing protein [Nocardia arthritidis]|nr:condensation domain-containing protein [Nocardia arthritidis]